MTVTDDLVGRVLDQLPVTDTVYHDLAHTRPLTSLLVASIAQIANPGRALLVGPNIALAEALVSRSVPIDIWHVPGVAMTENLRSRVTRVGSLDTLFSEVDGGAKFDVVVLPFVLDATAADPPQVLQAIRRITAPEGTVIVTARRAGALGARLQALSGRTSPTADAGFRHSWSWPGAVPRRRLDTTGLRMAAHSAGFRLAKVEAALDARATAGIDALTVSSWVGALLAHVVKQAIPPLRDTVVATLVPLPEGGRSRGTGGDFPLVSVVVVGSADKSAGDVAADLEKQTYPRDRIEVCFSAPDAKGANAALRNANGELIAFTDDLSYQPAGWLESGVRALGSYNAAVAGGVLVDEGSAHPFLAMPDRKVHAGGGGLYLASNSFYRREAVLSVGGFDETVGRAWGWDTTAALRLRAAGFPISEDDTTVVFRRYPFPTDRSWITDEFRRSRELPFAVKRDPGLRCQALDHRFFASQRTRCFDLALFGLVLAGSRRNHRYALVLAIPWARSIIKYIDLWPPKQWRTSLRHLRGIVLRNVIWFAGLLSGSLRSRKLVL